MSETTNLKLFKHDNPETNTDEFDVNKALNENWDKIDLEIGNINSNKVTKEKGKGLSTNDYTNEEKEKLATLQNYDDTELQTKITNIETNIGNISTILDNINGEVV